MTSYTVVNRFRDKQHDYIYEIGEAYPAEGKKLVKSRAEELTKIHPQYRMVFLEPVEVKKEPQKKNSKTEKSDD